MAAVRRAVRDSRQGVSTNARAAGGLKVHERLWSIFVAMPLALGIFDLRAGAWTISLTIVVMGFRQVLLRRRFGGLDLWVLLCCVLIVLSPFWFASPVLGMKQVWSPAIGAALGVGYVWPVRWFVSESRIRFECFVHVLIWLGVALAGSVMFLGAFADVGGGGSRWFVEFANANYLAAVIASCASFGLVILFDPLRSWGSRRAVCLWVGFLLIVLFLTGSRAGVAGVAFAAAGALSMRRGGRGFNGVVIVGMCVAFFVGFLPNWFASALSVLSESFDGVSTLAREASTLQDASGRLELWRGSLDAFFASPIVGWGPGSYGVLFLPGGVPAHAWGLEYLASVGVLGSIPLVIVIAFAYVGRWDRAGARPRSGRALTWNSVTAAALLPSLALSTHQWNAWAWVVIALWSCSSVLDADR